MKDILYADFDLNEYRQRVQRLQAAMDGTGLDALIITDPVNLRYVFGFQNLLQSSATRLFVGVFFKDAPDQSLLFIPHDCQDAPQSWIERIIFWDEGHEPPFDDRMADIGKVAERVKHFRLEHKRVGVELGEGTKAALPICHFDRLRSSLSEFELVDSAPVLWSLRQIKSESEIEILRRIAYISEKAITAAMELLSEGLSEKELYCEIQSGLFREGADGQGLLCVQFGVDGWRRANMMPTDQRELRKGEWAYIDGGGVLQGYHGDICRMGALGDSSKEQAIMYEAVQEAEEALIDAITPGMPCSELYKIGRNVLERRGCGGAIGSLSMGHGIGLNIHEMPDINLNSDEPLEEGMVLSIEPWCLDRVGQVGLFNLENMIVVRPEGAERLGLKCISA